MGVALLLATVGVWPATRRCGDVNAQFCLQRKEEECRKPVVQERCQRTCGLCSRAAKGRRTDIIPLPPLPPPAPSPPPAFPARSAECASFFANHFERPVIRSKADNFTAALHSAALHPPKKRVVWDAIVFGFEMPMLRLHMATLFASVGGFFVIEATSCFQTRTPKPAVFSDAAAQGSLPLFMTLKTRARVVGYDEAQAYLQSNTDPECTMRRRVMPGTGSNKFSTRCFQSFQRYLILEMVVKHAANDDLVLVSDVDEIAKPEVLQYMLACDPFDGVRPSQLETWSGGMFVLTARQFKFGVHCDTGHVWKDGPRLYSVRWLHKQIRRRMPASAFDKLRTTYGYSAPTLREGGWHLTSFGSTEELVRKLTTFGAANLFRTEESLSPTRLGACAAKCVELLWPRSHLGRPPQCHNESRRIQLSLPRLPGVKLNRLDGVDLPLPLLAYPGDYPSSWFEHLGEGAGPHSPHRTTPRGPRGDPRSGGVVVAAV